MSRLHDRRTEATVTTFADDAVDQLREEYESLPGMCLTLVQVARLLDVEVARAADIVAELEAEGLLDGTGGVYRRRSPMLS